MNTILPKTEQNFNCLGELYETSLKLEDVQLKVRDENGNEAGTKAGQRVMGEVAVKTSSGTFRFRVYGQSLNYRGEPSKMWNMYTKMLDWNPRVKGNPDEPTSKVKISGTVEVNDYVNQQNQLVEGTLRWNLNSAKTVDEETYKESTKGCTLQATLMVGKIVPEMRNEEETGRLIVTFYGVNGRGAVMPITAYVEAGGAETFADSYEKLTTAQFEFDLMQVGEVVEKKKTAWGHTGAVDADKRVRQELVCVGAFPPIEEPDELTYTDEDGNEVEIKTNWINPKAIVSGLKVRAEYLDKLVKDGYQGNKKKTASSGGSSLKARKEAARGKKSTAVFDDFDIMSSTEDDPF